MFQNIEPFNESNTQNQKNTSFNQSQDSTICIEKTIISSKKEDHNTCLLNISSDHNQSTNFNDYSMDLSTKETVNTHKEDSNYDNLLKEKDELNEKLTKYVEQLNQLNKNLSEAILTVQDKFETNLNEKNAIIQDLTLQNNVLTKEKKLATEDVQGRII